LTPPKGTTRIEKRAIKFGERKQKKNLPNKNYFRNELSAPHLLIPSFLKSDESEISTKILAESKMQKRKSALIEN